MITGKTVELLLTTKMDHNSHARPDDAMRNIRLLGLQYSNIRHSPTLPRLTRSDGPRHKSICSRLRFRSDNLRPFI